MKEVLLAQIEKYPDMGIQDMVKLLYQSEFGGGHMIDNPEKSLERLRQEIGQMSVWRQTMPWEDIGDGVCRIHLSVIQAGLSAETLNRIFVCSANRRRGSVAGFEKKLSDFVQSCERGEVPFRAEQVKQYLKDYQAQGYPAVSHSDTYRERYHPAYRVAERQYGFYYPVFLQIDELQKRFSKSTGSEAKPLLIAIDGKSGSGKTTLGRILQEVYDCRLFHMDDFFLQPEQRTEKRLQEPGGNVDYERFKAEVLDHIGDRKGLSYRVYDCSTQKLGDWSLTPYKRLNVIEGAYSQHPCFGDIYDLKFFCDIGEEEQVFRIRKRNGEDMLERFLKEWIPMENRYFEQFNIMENSIKIPPDYGSIFTKPC